MLLTHHGSRMDLVSRAGHRLLRPDRSVMFSSYATLYQDITLTAWDCRVAGLDAKQAWEALSAGRRLLRQRPDGTWHGALPAGIAPADSLHALLHAATVRPWTTIAAGRGLPAWGLSTSKGDPWACTSSGAATAGPGHLGARIARELGVGLHVPCATAAACSTGLYALLACADRIADGTCQRGLAGAADGALPGWLEAGFARLGVLCGSTAPTALAGQGTGFAPAAGAGVIALARHVPTPDSWQLRAGVRLGDAGHETHFVDPRTLHTALAALWSVLPQPDLIVTHATGTALGDAYELAGLEGGPWRDCPRLTLKPQLGHTLGASGAVELAIALEAPVRRLWKLSLGFGGHLAGVACERQTISDPG